MRLISRSPLSIPNRSPSFVRKFSRRSIIITKCQLFIRRAPFCSLSTQPRWVYLVHGSRHLPSRQLQVLQPLHILFYSTNRLQHKSAPPAPPSNLASDLKPAGDGAAKVKVRKISLQSVRDAHTVILVTDSINSHAAYAKTRRPAETTACSSPRQTTRRRTVRAWSSSTGAV
jgi:hypothetical protein